ncbi:MAG: polysaccharide pyruvyl transferase family protein [Chloroflexi bacterium]|nr:polysaccharide pyruvyl transferase family protein [Chloroflexota bacterium]
MNILITGAGFENKGAEAMLRTVQAELNKRLPDAEFFLWRSPQRVCRSAFNSGCYPLQLPYEKCGPFSHWAKGHRVRLLLWCLLEHCWDRDVKNTLASFASGQFVSRAFGLFLNRRKASANVLIDISGFAYGDSWGTFAFRDIVPLIEYCARKEKSVIFLPQAWGSFDKPEVRGALRQLLSYERAYVYSRDKCSCHYLEQALEQPQGSIPVTPDIVFGFQGGTPEQGERIVRNMGCSLSRPIIGLAPNMQVYKRVAGSGMGNKYLQVLVHLVDYCHKHCDVDVVLQSNNISLSQDRVDDRYLCSLIALSIANSERCFMTQEPLTAEATKALVGRFDYLIASRFHSLVFAFSQGIPGMAVSWSHKYRELFSLFGMEDQVQECQHIDSDALIETFEKGWAEREQQRESILKKAKQLRSEVNMLFDEVAEKILRNSELKNG